MKSFCAKCGKIFWDDESKGCPECGNKIGNRPWKFISAPQMVKLIDAMKHSIMNIHFREDFSFEIKCSCQRCGWEGEIDPSLECPECEYLELDPEENIKTQSVNPVIKDSKRGSLSDPEVKAEVGTLSNVIHQIKKWGRLK